MSRNITLQPIAETMPDRSLWLYRNRGAVRPRALIILGLIAALALVAFFFLRTHHDRRFAVYEIANRLERGMSLAEVEQILRDHWRPYMHRGGLVKNGAGAIQVTASFRWAEGMFLFIYFDQGRLIGTKMHGEDSPEDRYEDQPPDITVRD